MSPFVTRKEDDVLQTYCTEDDYILGTYQIVARVIVPLMGHMDELKCCCWITEGVMDKLGVLEPTFWIGIVYCTKEFKTS
jgi:hypothetical protein